MNRIVFFAILCLFEWSSILAQTTFDHFITEVPEITNTEIILPHPEGGYLLIGTFRSNFADIYSMKTDSLGKYEWHQIYGTSFSLEFPFDVKPTPDGNFIIVGKDTYHIYVLKIDSNGDLLWTKTYGRQLDAGRAIIPTENGYFLLAQSYGLIDGFISFSDYLLIELNSEGDSIEAYRYGRDGVYWRSYGMKLIEDRFILTGLRRSETGSYTVSTMAVGLTGDSLWNTQVQTLPGGGGMDKDMLQFNDQMLIIGGRALIMMDTTGQVIWQKLTGSNGNLHERRGAKLDEEIFLISQTYGTGESILAWMNIQGDTLQTDTIPFFQIADILSFPDRSLLLVGNSDVNGGLGELRLMRTDCQGNVQNPVTCWLTGIEALPEANIQIYPNPTTDRLSVDLPVHLPNVFITLYDLAGRSLGNYPLSTQQNTILLDGLPAGVLMYEIRDEQLIQRGKILIQK